MKSLDYNSWRASELSKLIFQNLTKRLRDEKNSSKSRLSDLNLTRLSDLNENNQIAFYEKLLSALPHHVDCKQNKAAKGVNFLPKGEALYKYKFIRFNTKKWVKVLIFDIDHVSGDLSKWHNDIKNILGIEPNYTTKTDNGYQFGFILENLVWIRNKDKTKNTNFQRIALLKKTISEKFKDGIIDHAGSIRKIGIWRNPVMHETIISENNYTLKDLSKHFKLLIPVNAQPEELNPLKSLVSKDNIIYLEQNSPNSNCKMKLSPNSKIQKILNKGFYKGNRNNYIFAFGYKALFEDRSRSSEIENIMQYENKRYSNPLELNEITDIAKSVMSKESSMYRVKANKKERGKLSNYMNDKSIQGLYNRQVFSGWDTSKTRRENTLKDVIKQLLDLFDKGIVNPTNKEVVQGLKIKKRQWQNVKKKINPGAIFLIWVKETRPDERSIGIRSYCMGLEIEPYFGIGKLIVKLVSIDGVIKYRSRSRDSWQNVIISDISPLRKAA